MEEALNKSLDDLIAEQRTKVRVHDGHGGLRVLPGQLQGRREGSATPEY